MVMPFAADQPWCSGGSRVGCRTEQVAISGNRAVLILSGTGCYRAATSHSGNIALLCDPLYGWLSRVLSALQIVAAISSHKPGMTPKCSDQPRKPWWPWAVIVTKARPDWSFDTTLTRSIIQFIATLNCVTLNKIVIGFPLNSTIKACRDAEEHTLIAVPGRIKSV